MNLNLEEYYQADHTDKGLVKTQTRVHRITTAGYTVEKDEDLHMGADRGEDSYESKSKRGRGHLNLRWTLRNCYRRAALAVKQVVYTTFLPSGCE